MGESNYKNKGHNGEAKMQDELMDSVLNEMLAKLKLNGVRFQTVSNIMVLPISCGDIDCAFAKEKSKHETKFSNDFVFDIGVHVPLIQFIFSKFAICCIHMEYIL